MMGRMYKEKALQAYEKASEDIFVLRNKGFENLMTINLVEHVQDGVKILKNHLLFGVYCRSLGYLEVITGPGPSVLKQSVVDLLRKENIKWQEVNINTLLIKFDGQKRELSFGGGG